MFAYIDDDVSKKARFPCLIEFILYLEPLLGTNDVLFSEPRLRTFQLYVMSVGAGKWVTELHGKRNHNF